MRRPRTASSPTSRGSSSLSTRHIPMKVNLDELTARVEQRLISVQQHPTEGLYIYNYTPLVQFSRAWDEYTLMCRGLILDDGGTVVARPFRKFFNLEEYVGTL